MDGVKEFLGLTMELIEVGADGQTAGRHDEPPSMSPGSASVGQRRFGNVRTFRKLLRWTQSCPRTGGALHARLKPIIERRGAQGQRRGQLRPKLPEVMIRVLVCRYAPVHE